MSEYNLFQAIKGVRPLDHSEWGRVGFKIQPFDTDGGKQQVKGSDPFNRGMKTLNIL